MYVGCCHGLYCGARVVVWCGVLGLAAGAQICKVFCVQTGQPPFLACVSVRPALGRDRALQRPRPRAPCGAAVAGPHETSGVRPRTPPVYGPALTQQCAGRVNLNMCVCALYLA